MTGSEREVEMNLSGSVREVQLDLSGSGQSERGGMI